MVEPSVAQIKEEICEQNTKHMHREQLRRCKKAYEEHIGTDQEAKYGKWWVLQWKFSKSQHEVLGYNP